MINSFDIFNTIILLWLILFCLLFLYNSIKRLMISELKIAIVCFAVMNVYMSMRYALSLASLVHDYQGSVFDNTTDMSRDEVFARILYVMDFIGIGLNIILLGMFCLVAHFVYLEMYKFIIYHLDGNRTMWITLREITFTRGILKLDILANLEFFSAFSFILFRDRVTVEPAVWGTLSGLFVVSILVQLYGSYGTVSIISPINQYLTLIFLCLDFNG